MYKRKSRMVMGNGKATYRRFVEEASYYRIPAKFYVIMQIAK